MKFICFPDWKITLLVNQKTDLQNKIIDSLYLEYETYLNNEYNNINNEHKIMVFSNYLNIEDLYNSLKDNISGKIITDTFKKTKFISFLIKPEYYLLQCIKSNQNYSLENFESIVLKVLNNVKKMVWNSKDILNPQWYCLSNSSNQKTTYLDILDDLNTIKDFLPESTFNNLISKYPNKLFIDEEKNNYSEINKLLYTLNYQEYQEIVKYLYQNDYYFINQFNKLIDSHKINYQIINKYKLKTKEKPPVFTIITPTTGTKTLYRLKQVLKQESISFIHLILWDKNRRVDDEGNYIKPEDLEDDNTFCYQFMHPYFEFKGQRNDVWLRGVGATLTNTPYVTYFDDDTWPERNHLELVMNYMNKKQINYTYVIRRMWENHQKSLGLDNFEAIGSLNKFGFRLIDNSSIYMRLEVARKVHNVFLANQVYGDDRFTPDFLDNDKECKGERMEKVLVNHIAKPVLLKYFKDNVTIE